MKKYLVLEGFVTSPLDNQRHFISCNQLVKLYKVDPKECVFGKADQYDPHGRRYEGKSIDGLCCLFPDSQGRYNIPQKFVPRAKDFEKEYSDDHKAYYVTNDEVYTLLKERPNFKFPSIYHAAHRMVNEIDGDYGQTVDLVYALLLKQDALHSEAYKLIDEIRNCTDDPWIRLKLTEFERLNLIQKE